MKFGMMFSGCFVGIGGSLKFLWNGRGRLKTKMERRRLVAKIGKILASHRTPLGVGLHKFQAASDHLIIEGSLKTKSLDIQPSDFLLDRLILASQLRYAPQAA